MGARRRSLFEFFSVLLMLASTSVASFLPQKKTDPVRRKFGAFGQERCWRCSGPLNANNQPTAGLPPPFNALDDSLPSYNGLVAASKGSGIPTAPVVEPTQQSFEEVATSLVDKIGSSSITKTAESLDAARDLADSVADNADSMAGNAGTISSILNDKTSAILEAHHNLADSINEKLSPGGMQTTGKMAENAEKILKAQQNWVNSVNEKLSPEGMQATKQNLIDFGKYYTASLDNYNKLSEAKSDANSVNTFLVDTVANSVNTILTSGKNTIDALNIEQYGALYLLTATFFWATVQRRDGIAYGKTLSEGRIQKLEGELKATKAAAKVETKVNTAEIEELRHQMGLLQTRVETLASVAQKMSIQLEQRDIQSVADKAYEIDHKTEKVAKKSEAPVVEPPPEEVNRGVSPGEKGAPKDVVSSGPKKKKTKRKTTRAKKSKDIQPVALIPEPMDEASPLDGGLDQTDEMDWKPEQVVAEESNKSESKVVEPPPDVASMQVFPNEESEPTNLISSPSGPKQKKTKPKQKSTPAKKSKQASAEISAKPKKTVTIQTSGDWSSLSQSTLKRKTVKELTGYLSDKGVEVTDTTGKTLRKDNLVDLVLSS